MRGSCDPESLSTSLDSQRRWKVCQGVIWNRCATAVVQVRLSTYFSSLHYNQNFVQVPLTQLSLVCIVNNTAFSFPKAKSPRTDWRGGSKNQIKSVRDVFQTHLQITIANHSSHSFTHCKISSSQKAFNRIGKTTIFNSWQLLGEEIPYQH